MFESNERSENPKRWIFFRICKRKTFFFGNCHLGHGLAVQWTFNQWLSSVYLPTNKEKVDVEKPGLYASDGCAILRGPHSWSSYWTSATLDANKSRWHWFLNQWRMSYIEMKIKPTSTKERAVVVAIVFIGFFSASNITGEQDELRPSRKTLPKHRRGSTWGRRNGNAIGCGANEPHWLPKMTVSNGHHRDCTDLTVTGILFD